MKKKSKIRLDEYVDLAIGMIYITFFMAMIFIESQDTGDKLAAVGGYILIWVLLILMYK